MKVNVSQLRARLSTYLHAARGGEAAVILNRNTPIAKLVPLAPETGGLQIVRASGTPGDIGKERGVRLKRSVDLTRVLAETRGER